jgi:hypothetical protein
MKKQWLFLFLIFSSCATKFVPPTCPENCESDDFLVLLVDAKHLDYSNMQTLLKSMVKHPGTFCKNSEVGHCWVYLRGIMDGECIEIEGGHSGELGISQPKYFEGVMNNIECGCKNPIEYLWCPLNDGYFEAGSGRHRPTYAVRIQITPSQFREIYQFIHAYPYWQYSLTQSQCTTFVTQIAELIGIELDGEVSVNIPQKMTLCRETLTLWQDPCYSRIEFPSPDRLEVSLKQLVCEGVAQDATDWYLRYRPYTFSQKMNRCTEAIRLFPTRLRRYLDFAQTD